ncbi:MAG: hypothetical protein QXD03_04780 [Candidatus Anstonellales archaeon]
MIGIRPKYETTVGVSVNMGPEVGVSKYKGDINKSLYSGLKTFYSKIPDGLFKYSLKQIIDNESISISINFDDSFVIPKFLIDKGQISILQYDVSIKGLDPGSPDNKIAEAIIDHISSNIDEIAYTVYAGLISATVISKYDDVRVDEDIQNLVSGYYSILTMKCNKDISLDVGSRSVFDSVVKYFVVRYIFRYNHSQAMSKLDPSISEKQGFLYLNNYNKFTDYIKALSSQDFAFIQNYSTASFNIVKRLGQVYQVIFSPDPFLNRVISAIVTARYPHKYFSHAFVEPVIHRKLESEMEKYVKEVKFIKNENR